MRKKKLTIITIVLAIIAVLSISFCVMLVINDTRGGKMTAESDIDVVPGIEDSIFDDETEFEEELVDNTKDEEENTGNTSGQKNNTSGNSQGNSQGSSNSSSSSSGTNSSGSSDSSSSGTNNSGNKMMNYEDFHAMSPSKQQEYMESYDDIEDFFDWYNAAKETYEKENPSIEVDGGSIDLDKVINGN